jgi:hypothetical protein
MSQHSRSLLLAALVAPWVSGAPFAFRVALWGNYGAGLGETLRAVGAVLLLAAPIGYIGMTVLGLPFAAWLLRRNRFCLAYLVPGGFTLAGLPIGIFVGVSEGFRAGFGVLSFMGLAGACVAATAGLLAGAPLRPNNSSKPTPLRGAA